MNDVGKIIIAVVAAVLGLIGLGMTLCGGFFLFGRFLAAEHRRGKARGGHRLSSRPGQVGPARCRTA